MRDSLTDDEVAQVETQRSIAGAIMDKPARFNATTREHARGVWDAMNWILGEMAPPFEAGDDL